MTEQEKSAHLLRRLGLGAGHYEEKRYSKGFRATLETLLADDAGDDGVPVDPWEIVMQPDGKLETGSYVLGPWWALKMLMTRTPMREKLTLFWHDHFALDAEKVGEAPMMIEYLNTLSAKGRGKFRDLLKSVMVQGAMLVFLDGHTSNLLHPNENLAREILELFTMGEGSGYTEKDVKELARALTGWSMHYLGMYLDEPYEKTKKRADDAKMAISNFCWVPHLHDSGAKTLLGKTANFTGEEALDWIADQPATARYICTKLWSFFAYVNPEPAVIDKLVSAWKKSDGTIRVILKTMAELPEFYSQKAVRSMPKSPVDWYVSIFRGFELQPFLLQIHGKPDNTKPLKKELREAGGGIYYLMSQQGLGLLFPPNVAGWNWGEGWINADISAKRIQSSNTIFWGGGDDRPMAAQVANKLKTDFKAVDTQKLIDGFLAIMDAKITDEQRVQLVAIAEKAGGVKALDDKNASAGLFANVSKALFAVPEYQLC